MLRQSGLIGLILAGVLIAATVRAQSNRPLDPVKQVQRDVESNIRSLYRGEVDLTLRYTHPAILRLLGGPEKARSTLTQIIAQIAKSEMKIESFSFPRAPEFFEGGGRKYVFVPTLMIVSANGQRAESLNFQLGILEPGTTDWKYIEGSRLTAENVQTFLPGFPKDRPFPAFYRKKL
ncbi:MAG TPA: hypothetical protein VJV78_03180 [Polyangiales bacterium]|nr:hypothetical protein [Polyangiales bacterium]